MDFEDVIWAALSSAAKIFGVAWYFWVEGYKP